MRRMRAFAAVTVLASLAVPTLAHAGSPSGRTLRAPYQGAYEIASVGTVGMGCAMDNCLDFQARRYEHRAQVTLRDAYWSSVPFVVYDMTRGNGDVTPTRHGCGRLSFRITPGHFYEVLPQDGVRGPGCYGLATRGLIIATLRR